MRWERALDDWPHFVQLTAEVFGRGLLEKYLAEGKAPLQQAFINIKSHAEQTDALYSKLEDGEALEFYAGRMKFCAESMNSIERILANGQSFELATAVGLLSFLMAELRALHHTYEHNMAIRAH